MTEDNEEQLPYSGTFLESKFLRILTIVITVILIFIGPTYVPYLMANIAGLDYFASIGVGFVLFIVGLVMLVYLMRKKAVVL